MDQMSREQFEKDQAALKAQADRAEMMQQLKKTQADLRIAVSAAHVQNQLMMYPQYRKFLDDNFNLMQGVDHDTQQVTIQVWPRDASWKPDTEEELMAEVKEDDNG